MEKLPLPVRSSLDEWANDHIGGLAAETVFGERVPMDITKVPEAYDCAFARFQSIVNIGKKSLQMAI